MGQLSAVGLIDSGPAHGFSWSGNSAFFSWFVLILIFFCCILIYCVVGIDEASAASKLPVAKHHKEFLIAFFKTLRLNDMEIDQLDAYSLKMIALEELSLNHNVLTRLDLVPQNLRRLHVFNNQLTTIAITHHMPL